MGKRRLPSMKINGLPLKFLDVRMRKRRLLSVRILEFQKKASIQDETGGEDSQAGGLKTTILEFLKNLRDSPNEVFEPGTLH